MKNVLKLPALIRHATPFAVSNSKTYVSDLYSRSIHIIDLSTGSKTGSINARLDRKDGNCLWKSICYLPKQQLRFVLDAQTNKLNGVWVGQGAGSRWCWQKRPPGCLPAVTSIKTTAPPAVSMQSRFNPKSFSTSHHNNHRPPVRKIKNERTLLLCQWFHI